MSLTGTYDPDNVFGRILRSELPCAKIFEDDIAIGFLDLFPQSEGHSLVIPKAPSRNLLDADPTILSALMPRAQAVAKAVNAVFNPDGIVLTQFSGAPAGQTVFHLHLHVIPVYRDRPASSHGRSGQADPGVLQDFAARLAQAYRAV